MPKYAGRGVFSRALLSKIFPKKNKRSDDECWELEHFIGFVMQGCPELGDLKHWADYCKFCAEYSIPAINRRGEGSPVWNMWLAQADPMNDKWPVVEKRGGQAVWAWFEKSMQVGEWVPVGEECPVTKRLVPFKNGYFKAVPLE